MADRIRASSTDEAADCARRHAAKSLTGEIKDCGYDLGTTKDSIGSLVGRAVHKVNELLLVAKRDRRMLSVDDAIIEAMPGFYLDVRKGVELDDTTPNEDVAERQIRRAAEAYHARILPGITPILIEQKFTADAGDGFELSGSLDLLAAPATIEDCKNEKASNSSHIAQLGSYSLLAKSNGYPVDRLIVDRIIRQSDKAMREGEAEIRRVEYPVVVAERMALNVIRQVKRDVLDFRERMRSEDQAVRENAHEAFVANPSSMLCSPLYCRAWGSSFCPESVARQPKEESEEM